MAKRRPYAARVPADERRAQLLDAALHLVVTRGHNATTMDAIAKQAGVTKPVVYGQFGSRNELLAALLRREQEAAVEQLVTALRPAGDPADFLAQALSDFLAAVQAAPQRWHCIVMPMADMPPEFHAARESARALVLARAEEVARWLLSDLGADLDPEIAAHAAVAMCEMAARLVLTSPERFTAERFVAAVRATLGLVR
ncbi:TetR/AcrR family transcriptional regulator [Fodinicola acaciae]|uniref:TetR/AcrR family transcriptional regulator n=1 Tax=Fodinicola acaciae TaxID=2681555 RepID=UPI0013D89A48|nr:TetR/AcrR family transcriptional regulator [Fodinicola acaciae]